MLVPKTDRRWSAIALYALFISFAVSAVFAILDGMIRYHTGSLYNGTPEQMMVATWIVDFRYVAENVMVPAAIMFVGGRFIETRTNFTIGFDKLDTGKIKITGPDAENIVWVGHRYGTALEANAVAAVLAERIHESGAPTAEG